MVINFSPSRSSTHGVTGSIGCACASARIASKLRMLRQPLEIAARRENQARFAALLALQGIDRGYPASAGAFALVSPAAASRRAGSARRRTRCRSGGPRETSAPSARRESAPLGRRLSPAALSTSAKSLSAVKSSLQLRGVFCRSGTGANPTGIAVSSIVSRIAATNAAVVEAELSGELAIRRRRCGRREDQRSRGEGHAFRALDHQELGRPVRRFAHDDQRCGGDRLVGH